jgi:hypothetical protein
MAEHRTRITPLYTNFSKNATEERIMSIMKFKKASVSSLIVALIFVMGSTVVFAGSVPNTVTKLRGIIQTNSGSFGFDVDEKGIVTVKDSDGRIISKSSIDKDGKFTLTDGNGKIIKTFKIDMLRIKKLTGKL